MKHRETHQPAPATPPSPGRELLRRQRPNGDEVTITGFCLPRPHLRVEVRRGESVRAVTLALAELADVAYALLRAPRVLAAQARRGQA